MNELVFYNREGYRDLKVIALEKNDLMSYTEYTQKRECKPHCKFLDISTLIETYGKFPESVSLYGVEIVMLDLDDSVTVVCDEEYKNDAAYVLRNVCILSEDINFISSTSSSELNEMIEQRGVKKIIDLDIESKEHFINAFEKKLQGHEIFKRDFVELVDSFRLFNRVGEHPILSIFIMGDSGVGKTEVAKVIHNLLKGTSSLAKINLGNYSSKDALNSLIGSPLGYIGSDGGELFKKIRSSDTGILLIDEFEKADSAIFNYFLDVLESGKASNNQAEEIDMNGYVIIFTSNITKDRFIHQVSPELRSRFDYITEFSALRTRDKELFVEKRIRLLIQKLYETYNILVSDDDKNKILSSIDVRKYTNMRNLKHDLNAAVVRYFRGNHKQSL